MYFSAASRTTHPRDTFFSLAIPSRVSCISLGKLIDARTVLAFVGFIPFPPVCSRSMRQPHPVFTTIHHIGEKWKAFSLHFLFIFRTCTVVSSIRYRCILAVSNLNSEDHRVKSGISSPESHTYKSPSTSGSKNGIESWTARDDSSTIDACTRTQALAPSPDQGKSKCYRQRKSLASMIARRAHGTSRRAEPRSPARARIG